jgi:hypothetical protein
MPLRTITLSPAAGPLTLNADPLKDATTIPPTRGEGNAQAERQRNQENDNTSRKVVFDVFECKSAFRFLGLHIYKSIHNHGKRQIAIIVLSILVLLHPIENRRGQKINVSPNACNKLIGL